MASTRRFGLTWLAWFAVALLLAVGFGGYLHPDMRLDWAAIAQMCGLR
jgi:hypothetical protein